MSGWTPADRHSWDCSGGDKHVPRTEGGGSVGASTYRRGWVLFVWGGYPANWHIWAGGGGGQGNRCSPLVAFMLVWFFVFMSPVLIAFALMKGPDPEEAAREGGRGPKHTSTCHALSVKPSQAHTESA